MQPDPEMLAKCWFLTGPTACGKTEVSLKLAEQLNAEIIALDSMSLYRGMDIGTAKPSPAERQRVPHHLVDVLDPDQEYSLAQYVDAALAACSDITSRGRVPLFVGGTGLYLRGILRGVFEGPPADWSFREKLQAEAAGQAPDWLLSELQRVDPETASRLHPNDHRRIVRALEVHHLTGRPLSELQSQQPLPEDQRPRHVFWLEPRREWLHERIDSRVDRMIEDGLVDEVCRLQAAARPPGRTARQALGYAEIFRYLEDEIELDEAIETIKTRTRQFAKRQHTWFRNLVECRAIETSGDDSASDIAGRLLAAK